ncbi:MAG: universal stress protein [Xanthobacteraceae bacterium]|nr:universal stress protein [Xanthobacteraceae bacterium]
MKLLAATDFSTRSNRALRQAGLLAHSNKQAHLHVVHVVDDDQPTDLINLEKLEAGRLLQEQVRSMPELQNIKVTPVVTTGYAFDGILKTADTVNADLIVMGSHRKQLLLDIFTGTTIERVIRKGTFPVLMVNFEAQRSYGNIVAPIDTTESSAPALKVALALGLMDSKHATILHAFTPLAKGKMYVANADTQSINRYVAKERAQVTDDLAAFLAANKLNENSWSFRVEEGAPFEVIAKAVNEMRPDLLVMGTQTRRGLLKSLIGSVTEEALRSLNVDILAVPSA